MPFLITIYVLIIIDAILGIGSRIPILDDLLTQPISKSTALWVIITSVFFILFVWYVSFPISHKAVIENIKPSIPNIIRGAL